MLLQPIIVGISNMVSSVTQMFKKFFVAALSPVFYNLGIIVGIVVLYPLFGVNGLAFGVVLGAVFHLLIQLPVLIHHKMIPRITTQISFTEIKSIIVTSIPRTIGLSMSSFTALILTSIASTLATGSISLFNLTNNMLNVPIGIVGISYSVASFPALVKYFQNNEHGQFAHHILNATRKIIFWSVPIMVLFIILRAQIVRLTLGAGVFNWNDTIRTADVLGIFAASLVFQGLAPLFARAFYALQDTWTPLISGIVSEVLNLGFALWLRGPFGIMGLALAYSLSSTCEIVILWLLLRRRTGSLSPGTWISMLKTTAASMALLGFGWVARQDRSM
jgi:putative peptidoglycan lipid II flippase